MELGDCKQATPEIAQAGPGRGLGGSREMARGKS